MTTTTATDLDQTHSDAIELLDEDDFPTGMLASPTRIQL